MIQSIHPAFFVSLFVIGTIILILLTIGQAEAQARRRTAEVKEAAAKLGLDFQEEAHELLVKHSALHLLSLGHSQRVRNLLSGSLKGRPVCVFDLEYTSGLGKRARVWRQTVISFDMDEERPPAFSMRPERLFHKVWSWFGYQDIDFESHPKFSGQYLLRGPDEAAVRALFSPKVLDHFTGQAGLSVEGAPGVLICYQANVLQRPEALPEFIARGEAVHQRFAA